MLQYRTYFWNISKVNDIINWKKIQCDIRYIHLLQFVYIETDTKQIKIILNQKDMKLANQIKKLCKLYNKYIFTKMTIIIKDDIELYIEIPNYFDNDFNITNNIFNTTFYNAFNEELTDKILKYFKYEFNFQGYGMDYFECDQLIAPAVDLFNQKNYPTKFSCDGDDSVILNPKIHSFDIADPKINHCTAYLVFRFKCQKEVEYIKIKNIFKDTYTELISKGLEKDVLSFEFDDINESSHEKLYHITIRSKTPNRLIWNRILFEYASLIPIRK